MSSRRHVVQSPSVTPQRSRLYAALNIGEQLRLSKLVDLGDDTGPKAAKEPKAKAGVYDKPKKDKAPPPKVLKEFEEEDYPAPTYNGEVVQTVKLDIKNSTELERKWLRENYTDSWSEAVEPLKTQIKDQARKVLSFQIAPKIIEAIEDERSKATVDFNKDNLTEKGGPKLVWVTEVLPKLLEMYPPPLDWRKNEAGAWLAPAEKDARAEAAKEALRPAKMAALEIQRGIYILQRAKARVAKAIEDLNYPDAMLKRKARALLRHWFNRKGKPDSQGIKDRVWNKPGLDGDEDSESTSKLKKKVSTDVTVSMHKARLKWAKLQVGPEYDPTNPPKPPSTLYTPLDISPLPDQYLPDEVNEISREGGQWLWSYMRTLESLAIETGYDFFSKLLPVDDSARYWDAPFRVSQRATIKDAYAEFILSVDEMSEVPQAKDIAFSYTVSSTRFNKYLLWPSSKVGGDPRKIPASGTGVGGVGGNDSYTEIGPPDALHRLYKLINRCPRLPTPAIFLRAGNGWKDLPHNLGKAAPITPVVGRGYLNVTFMSTSSADPDHYSGGALSMFYNHGGPDGGCCMFAVTCPTNSPVLPLVLGGSDASAYSTEQEVVLPPGLVLIYQGSKKLPVGANQPLIHFYQAELAPKPPGMAGPSG